MIIAFVVLCVAVIVGGIGSLLAGRILAAAINDLKKRVQKLERYR